MKRTNLLHFDCFSFLDDFHLFYSSLFSVLSLEKFLFVWFVSISLWKTMHQHLSFWANSAKSCIAEIFATWWNVERSESSCFTEQCLQKLRKGKRKEVRLQLKVKASRRWKSKQKQSNWSNKNATQTLGIFSCRKCQVILNDLEKLELWSCLVRKAPSALSAEPPHLPWGYFLFSQTHWDPQAVQLNTLFCLMLSERK